MATLLRDVVLMLGEPVTRAAVYDLEQGVQQQVAEELLPAAIGGELQPSELLTESPRDLSEAFMPRGNVNGSS